MATIADRKMLECVHFNGIQHGACKAGVNYADVRDETTRPHGFPCLAQYAGNATCPKLERMSREQAEAEEAAFQAAFARVNTCRGAIKEKHGKARGIRDEMPCPMGCGGTLRYSIASYNGHIHGACSTDGCASWME